jgi:surface antigen
MTRPWGTKQRRAAVAAAMAVLLAIGLGGCSTIDATIDATVGEALRAQQFPPPRRLFATLSPEDAARHEQAVVAALQSHQGDAAQPWSGADPEVAGTVGVLGTYQHTSGLVCRRISDELRIAGETETAIDLACWSDGQWVWARDGGPVLPVLASS